MGEEPLAMTLAAYCWFAGCGIAKRLLYLCCCIGWLYWLYSNGMDGVFLSCKKNSLGLASSIHFLDRCLVISFKP